MIASPTDENAMQEQTKNSPKKTLPLADTRGLDGAPSESASIDAQLRDFENAERARLGIPEKDHWVETMANAAVKKSERGEITILLGGLTKLQDTFVESALGGLGYNVLALDCPDEDAFRAGKEFGNRGQCNPTYFTVGNVVKFLIHLRDEKGMTAEEIVKKYIFLTAGACGPCRFGMYTTEYRKALRDAGFDGFRIMLFQQQGGLSQATGEESGLEFTPPFFIGIVKALVAGDVLNALSYRIRPYEVEKGSTDAAIAECRAIVKDTLKAQRNVLGALWRCQRVLAKVKVDRTLVRPRVAIIGEFWAMTTEGDGNYQLQRFLEKEGAECDVQLVTAWLLYNVWEVKFDTEARALLRGTDTGRLGLSEAKDHDVHVRMASLWAADLGIRALFQTFAWFGGLRDFHLADMDEVAEVASTHYDNDLRGGEGHMEVGKLILNVVKQKATMTLSVKPFGCMPSGSVSDGVQSLITERFPGTIYCPVETSGDGAVNFQSRVQMYLFKAKQAAEAEVQRALSETGLTMEEVRAFLAANPRFQSALHRAPHTGACTTTDLIHEVARYAKQSRAERIGTRLRSAAATGALAARWVRDEGPAAAKKAYAVAKTGRAEIGEILAEKVPEWIEGRRSRVPAPAPAPATAPVAATKAPRQERHDTYATV
jgi:predicted nucleotide-binding protein (sugar kinase/HSP70/actin superfamily)